MLKIVKNEIHKLLARKRIYFFMAILLLIAIITLVNALKARDMFRSLPSPGENPSMQEQIMLSLARDSGQAFPLALLDAVASFIIPAFIVILVAGMVTDEYADGSLKLPLLRQVSRMGLLLGKMTALLAVIAAFMVFLLVIGYGLGIIFLGWSGDFVIKSRFLTPGQGIELTLLAYGLSIVSFICFGMVVLFLAILIPNSGSMTAAGLGLLLASLLAGEIFPEKAQYLITTYFNTYNLFSSGMSSGRIITGFLTVLCYGAVFFAMGNGIFKRKDLLI
jgi:ABC-2 type transport system permease protein